MNRHLLVAVAALAAAGAQAATKYRVDCLDCAYSAAQGGSLSPVKINNAGTVVANDMATGQGYVLANGLFAATPVLAGYVASSANDINDAGHVVGTQTTSIGLGYAYFWDGTTGTLLGTLDGYPGSEAYSLNASDQVTGTSDHVAFVYSGGVMQALPALPSQAISWGNAINAAGHVAGSSQSGSSFSNPHAWVFGGGTTFALSKRFLSSQAIALNDLDQSAGSVDAYAATWDDTGKVKLLNTLPGFSGGQARAINVHGFVVGTLVANNSAGFPMIAFVYDQTKVRNLNKLIDGGTATGWTLNEADSINDSGVIVGRGTLDGEPRAFIATPVHR